MVAFSRAESLARGVDGFLTAVMKGRSEHVVSFAGRSQYVGGVGGASACGLVALNCARLVLSMEHDGIKDLALLREMMKKETLEDVLRICFYWSTSAHLDVDEIVKAPIFNKTLSPLWSQYAQPGKKQFRDMLIRLQQATVSSAALVITRPPEIVCLLKIVTEMKDTYVLFDSHPRHNHPDGAAFIFHPSLDAAAEYLSELFKFDKNLLTDPNLQWQAQLLANFCGHAFVIKSSLSNASGLVETVIESSSAVLSLKADVAELQRANSLLQSQVNDLSEENLKLQDDLRSVRRPQSAKQPSQHHSSVLNTPSGTWKPSASQSASAASSSSGPKPSSSRSLSISPPAAPNRKGKLVMRTVDEVDDDDFAIATRIQLEWQTDPDDQDASAKLAAAQQREYEEEDRRLRAQMRDLQKTVPTTFHCGVCLDEHSEYMIARVELCGHVFCRDCVRGYIQSKLGDHRFPILCPTCAMDADKADPGTLSTVLVQQIGLSEQEFQLFTELELSAFSVLLHCRKCQQAVFVDKPEYEAQDLIVCPLPGCNHVWCKNCSREIEVGGPQHSCDGSNELNYLMSQRGWKHCPGCRTPTEKVEGCNHMTCPSPGCNTHFCYLCGATIVQSVRPQDIRRALSQHYARCRMIDDV